MNKVIHGLIAVVFGTACWFLWVWLTVSARFMQRVLSGEQIPAFTILVLNLRPLLVILPILTGVYCLFVWFRRDITRATWQGFFASTMAVLILVLLPCLLAVWLPVLSMIEKIGAR
jgi:hypothetical protein